MNCEQLLKKGLSDQAALNSKVSLTKKEFAKKDKTKAEKLALTLEYVVYLRQSNPIFLRTYAKDPIKQNITEKIVRNFLEQVLNTGKVEKLPTGKKKCYKISGGGIHIGQQGVSPVKSLDFYWKDENSGKEAYATQKYTSSKGGTQDNAEDELKRFMDEGRLLARADAHKNKIVFAIADGSHYEGLHAIINRDYGFPGRVICCKADDVAAYWNQFLSS